MDTNVLLSIILVVIYFGIGYISTLVIDLADEKYAKSGEKMLSIFLWPLMLIGYILTKFNNK